MPHNPLRLSATALVSIFSRLAPKFCSRCSWSILLFIIITEIHGCGVHCSSPSNCFHNFVVFSSSHHPTLRAVECMSSKFSSRFMLFVSRLCTDCLHFIIKDLTRPDLFRIRRQALAGRCIDFALPQNFFVVRLPRFSSFFYETCGLIFLLFEEKLPVCH